MNGKGEEKVREKAALGGRKTGSGDLAWEKKVATVEKETCGGEGGRGQVGRTRSPESG